MNRTPSLLRRFALIVAFALALTGIAGVEVAQASAGPKPTATALGADVVKLKWSAVSGAASYRVRYSTSSKMSGSTTVSTVDGAPITTAFTNISGLGAKKTYYFQVVGIDASGKQLNSWGNTSKSAKTFYSYGAPSGLAAANIASSWVELSWQPVSGAPGYRVRYYNRTDKARYVWNQVENFTLYGKDTSDHLRRNTAYWLKVAVQQPPIGTPGTEDYKPLITMSPYSKELKLTTSNYDISAPSNLQVSEQTPNTVKVSWDAPPDLAEGYQFRVQYSTSSSMSSSKSTYVPATDNSVTLTGLANNTTYYVRVMVVDAASAQKSDRSAYQIAKTRVPRGTITGKVIGPAPGDVEAMVYTTSGELVAESDLDSSGRFSASVRPGSYKVLLTYLGTGDYVSRWVTSAENTTVSGEATVLSVPSAASTVTAPDTTLVGGAVLSGTVKNSGGSALQTVWVTSLTASTAAREVEEVTQTDNSGKFTIRGLAEGGHWLRFVKSGYSNTSVWINVHDGSVKEYRVSTSTEPTSLGSGQPLPVPMR